MRRFGALVGALMLLGCGLPDPGDGHDDDDGGVDIEMTTADNEDPGDTVCACAPDNDNIYVMAEQGEIWTFNPDTLEFKFVTRITCGEYTAGSKAMAVSRKGRLWVEFHSGDIHTVDLTAPALMTACMDPGFDTCDDPMFAQFGMAFVANSATDPCEKLYLSTSIPPDVEAPMGRYSGALGVVDPDTLALSRIAAVEFTDGELTGTRDGRMFAFLPFTGRSYLEEFDKDTGEFLGHWSLPGLGKIGAYSFTFWGGSFYFFTAGESDGENSQVTRFDVADQDGEGPIMKIVVAEAPIRVVAATVSTCAPSCPRSWRATCSL